ncbi:MAG: orotidine-5'-phosphate decarboxylase [Planctomycetota bacterium]
MGINWEEKIIVALDFDHTDEMDRFVSRLKKQIQYVKVGMQLFYAEGPPLVAKLLDRGLKVFLDLKIHDIPNTASKSALQLAKMGVQMITVHASGGIAMIRAVHESVHSIEGTPPKILAVTQLTSISPQILNDELKVSGDLSSHVLHLAKLAQHSGADGVIASGLEVSLLRQQLPDPFLIIIPGVRMNPLETQDQIRVVTPKEAFRSGANAIVVGRELTKSPNPELFFEQLMQHLEAI